IQCLTDRLHDAAMELSVDQQWVDHFSAVVDSDITEELCLAGVLINLNDTNVCAERESKVLWLEEVSCRQARLGVRRKFLCDVGYQSNLLNGQSRTAFCIWLRKSAGGRFAYWNDRFGNSGRRASGSLLEIPSAFES